MKIKWIPEPKIYKNKYTKKTVKNYARLICRSYYKNYCYLCFKKCKGSFLHGHHKNKNVYDNRVENLINVCAKCHKRLDMPIERCFTIKICKLCKKEFLKRNCEIKKNRLGNHFCSNICRRKWFSVFAKEKIILYNKTKHFEKYRNPKNGRFYKIERGVKL